MTSIFPALEQGGHWDPPLRIYIHLQDAPLRMTKAGGSAFFLHSLLLLGDPPSLRKIQ
jgi:hypothetical protein